MAKRKKKVHLEPTPELPPTLPSERPELERAIVLLGARAKGLELNPKPRAELMTLLGGYPSPAEAANWKLALKQVRDDEIFERAV